MSVQWMSTCKSALLIYTDIMAISLGNRLLTSWNHVPCDKLWFHTTAIDFCYIVGCLQQVCYGVEESTLASSVVIFYDIPIWSDSQQTEALSMTIGAVISRLATYSYWTYMVHESLYIVNKWSMFIYLMPVNIWASLLICLLYFQHLNVLRKNWITYYGKIWNWLTQSK